MYVGRLSEEKGLRILLGAWARLREPIPLRIAGDGPLGNEIAREIRGKNLKSVELTGRLSQAEIISLMHGARFLILPSVCYENFPSTIAEAFACGLPVIASQLGAMAEIIEDGATGLHFFPGDAQDLSAKVEWAWAHPHELCELGRAARSEYEHKYTGTRNYERTMEIYARAMKDSSWSASCIVREPSMEKARG